MWFLLVSFLLLAMLVAYVTVRDSRHPVHHPPKSPDQGWGNRWPR